MIFRSPLAPSLSLYLARVNPSDGCTGAALSLLLALSRITLVSRSRLSID